jgi:hypothetical protein
MPPPLYPFNYEGANRWAAERENRIAPLQKPFPGVCVEFAPTGVPLACIPDKGPFRRTGSASFGTEHAYVFSAVFRLFFAPKLFPFNRLVEKQGFIFRVFHRPKQRT